ncbi:hypothetical protein bcgnr5378_07180 [Bacillus cereus]|uniref:SbsA Ig-like domain-containing protein n=1 Tax=Bacillus cereus TaxID=1396 RepID=A0A164NXN4_BACCE|nr:hypothetical protein [Bacillus cereus]KZD65972.1 hypothetical protein B4088_2729 [Bacillus cereus]
MKKGIIVFIGLVIASIIAFFIYQSKEKPTNTITKEEAVTKPKPMENVEKSETPIKPNIEPDHVWRFPFKEAIDKETIENKVYILNEEKQKVQVSVEVNDKEILVRPPQEGYGKDKTYELFVDKEIKQVDGKNIEPIHFTFITKRDEVANVKFSEDIIKIKHSEVKSVNGDVLVLNNTKLKDKIKKDSLIAIEINETDKSEAARKVVSVTGNNKELTIDTKTPEFEELFEELDLYKEVPITSEHIKLESIKGLTLSNRSTALSASATGQSLAEGKGSNSTLHFDNVKWNIDGTEIALNGTLDLNNLKGTPDTVIKKKSIKKFNMYYEQKAEARLSVSVKGEKQKVQLEDKRRLKIGDVGPIPLMTGVSLNGDLYLVISTSVSGEPTVTLTLTAENESGVHRKNKKFKVFSDTNFSNSSLQVHGEGHIDTKVAVEPSIFLKAFEILSVGVGAEIGGYSNATVYTNKQEAFTCEKGELGGGWSGEIFVKAFPKFSNIWNKETHYKYNLRTKFIEKKKNLIDVNTCKEAKGLIPSETPIQLEPGEESDIGLQLVEYDHGKADEKQVNLGKGEQNKLSVKSKDENVATAKVTEEGAIRVEAGTMPAKTNTEIVVTYTDDKLKGNKTVTIPVQIKNYDPNVLKGLEGMWRVEEKEPYFYKISTKGQKTIEFTAMRLLENDYTAVVDITKAQKIVMSGKPDYTFVYPGIFFEPASEISIEKLSKDKIKISEGNVTRTVVRTTDDARNKEIMKNGSPNTDEKTEVNPPNSNNPNSGQKNNTDQSKSLKAFFDPVDSNSEIQVGVFIQTWGTTEANPNIDKATLNVDQSINNTFTGLFETIATKQNDTTWTFSWTDSTGTKGTGTLVINGDNATIDLKSERKSTTEGKGIVSHKTQLTKTSEAAF